VPTLPLGWQIYLYEQSEGRLEPESTLFYSLAISLTVRPNLEVNPRLR
jgi:hypothetical protein